MARLYSNENFPLRVVNRLISLGYDVVTTHNSGRANQQIPDNEVLSFASSQGRAVLTLNQWHFVKLHRINPNHAGIIVCTADKDYLALARRIDAEIKKHPDLDGKLIRITKPQS